jgi:hypothetical protein
VGLIVVDQAGSRIWHNRRASEIASDPRALTFVGQRLAGRDSASTQSIRELIARAVDRGEAGLLPIEREDSRPLLLVAAPLKPSGMYDLSAQPGETGYGVLFVLTGPRT